MLTLMHPMSVAHSGSTLPSPGGDPLIFTAALHNCFTNIMWASLDLQDVQEAHESSHHRCRHREGCLGMLAQSLRHGIQPRQQGPTRRSRRQRRPAERRGIARPGGTQRAMGTTVATHHCRHRFAHLRSGGRCGTSFRHETQSRRGLAYARSGAENVSAQVLVRPR